MKTKNIMLGAVLLSLLTVITACSGGGGGGGGAAAPSGGTPAGQHSIAYAVIYSAPAGSCPSGGITVYAGIDTNSNGVLDPSEYTGSPQYVCNGADGADGGSVAMTLITLPTGSMGCAYGGTNVCVGPDADRDNVPDSITTCQAVCNGVDGGTGTSAFYTIGGTMSGLTGTIVLQKNGYDDITLTADGAFTFPTPLIDSSKYNIIIKTPPSGQVCGISNGSGTVTGENVTNIAVDCSDGTNTPPVANAGPDQNVATGSTVTVNGSGSWDSDGDTLNYSWSITAKPAGSTVALSSATIVKPTFTADLDGSYELSLVVNDGTVDSVADTVIIKTIKAGTYDFGPIDQSLIDTSAACDTTAGTVITGGTIAGQTWTLAGSPYIIQGDITVLSGQTLVINAGVTVCIASTDAMAAGVDTSKVEITVNGAIHVSGSASSPVIFRSVDATDTIIWRGIIINPGSTGDVVDYAFIKNAYAGINNGGQIGIANSVFMRNTYGVSMTSDANITSSVFLQNTVGVYSTNGNTALSNLLIYGNASMGVSLSYASPSNTSSVTIDNCTIDRNASYGVYFYSSSASSSLTVRNSIVTMNGYGVYKSNIGSATVNYSNVWGNATSNYFGCSAGTGSISSNPMYVSWPRDYSLSSGSFSIDAGVDLTSVTTDIRGIARPIDGNGDAVAAFDLGAYEM
jgi:hypothetical protein